MDLLDTIRIMVGESFGTPGAVRNCRAELRRRHDVEAAVGQLCERLPVAGDPILERQDSA